LGGNFDFFDCSDDSRLSLVSSRPFVAGVDDDRIGAVSTAEGGAEASASAMAAAVRAVSRFRTWGGKVKPFVQMSRIFLVFSCGFDGAEGGKETTKKRSALAGEGWDEREGKGRRVELNEQLLLPLQKSASAPPPSFKFHGHLHHDLQLELELRPRREKRKLTLPSGQSTSLVATRSSTRPSKMPSICCRNPANVPFFSILAPIPFLTLERQARAMESKQ